MNRNRITDTTLSGRGDGVNIRYFLFLSLGVERTYSPPGEPKRGDALSEPSGSRICRRNILALTCMVVLAGFAEVDPLHLSVFGLRLAGEQGVWVLGGATISAQLYWYVMRYHHLTADGAISSISRAQYWGNPDSGLAAHLSLERKPADLMANRAAACLTILSWYFIALWIYGPDS